LPFVDPVVVFGQNTSLSTPDGFVAQPLADLSLKRQITTGRTPCGFFGASLVLAPGDLTEIWGFGFRLPRGSSGTFYLDRIRLP
jgi:hypothetical protein